MCSPEVSARINRFFFYEWRLEASPSCACSSKAGFTTRRMPSGSDACEAWLP